jgi:hypothetical protein
VLVLKFTDITGGVAVDIRIPEPDVSLLAILAYGNVLILIVVDSPGVIEFVISNVVDVKLFCFSPNDVDNPDIF